MLLCKGSCSLLHPELRAHTGNWREEAQEKKQSSAPAGNYLVKVLDPNPNFPDSVVTLNTWTPDYSVSTDQTFIFKI